MRSKRGNPVEGHGRYVKLSQGEGHPVGDEANTDKGNPARLRVPQNKAQNLNQKVGHPSLGRARGGADCVKK